MLSMYERLQIVEKKLDALIEFIGLKAEARVDPIQPSEGARLRAEEVCEELNGRNGHPTVSIEEPVPLPGEASYIIISKAKKGTGTGSPYYLTNRNRWTKERDEAFEWSERQARMQVKHVIAPEGHTKPTVQEI